MNQRKICSRCGKERYIWKSEGKLKYCQSCWYYNKVKPLENKSKKRTVINKISDKTLALNKIYSVLRDNFLSNNTLCKIHIPGICTSKATDVHHSKGRGEYMLDDSTFIPTCRACHKWAEENPEAAKELGFSVDRLSNSGKNSLTN